MTEQEMIEQLPEPTKTNAKVIMMLKPEELPEKPEKGKWYVYRPDGCVCADGTPYYSCLRVGDPDKILVMFCGGGVALDPYQAARPNKIAPTEGETTFYAPTTFVMGYFTGRSGLAQVEKPNNPFKEWSICAISYAGGDFHSGTRDFEYDDTEKGKGVCHHNGYTCYRAMIEKLKEFVPIPEKIVVTGYSAGGWGASLLTDDVMRLFPDCNDVTCAPDSCMFSYPKWTESVKQWGTPKEIADRVHSDNISLDCILDLYRTHKGKVKIAFSCSYRDALLAQCESYTHGEGLVFSQKGADIFQETLTKAVKILKKEIPDIALFIFDKPSEDPNKIVKNFNMTEHTIVAGDWLYDYEMDGVKFIDWFTQATEGKPQQVGLHLLGL